MQLNQLNLADIRAFVLIAKLGNFTKAAEELEVSRSHVSRQLSQLENSMGVTLVIRTTRSLSLTDAGELFYRQCEQALSSIEQAVLAAVDDVQEARGELRINSVGGAYWGRVNCRHLQCFYAGKPRCTYSPRFQ